MFTPVSNNSEEEHAGLNSNNSPIGALRVQTNFDNEDVVNTISDVEDESIYDSGEETERKSHGKQKKPKYTTEEEKQVVKIFDRRLVPFLALLYLLAFLDRSSMLMTLIWFRLIELYLYGY